MESATPDTSERQELTNEARRVAPAEGECASIEQRPAESHEMSLSLCERDPDGPVHWEPVESYVRDGGCEFSQWAEGALVTFHLPAQMIELRSKRGDVPEEDVDGFPEFLNRNFGAGEPLLQLNGLGELE